MPEGFLLDHPALDFSALAQAHGMGGMRVTTPEEAIEAARRQSQSQSAFLVDLVIDK